MPCPVRGAVTLAACLWLLNTAPATAKAPDVSPCLPQPIVQRTPATATPSSTSGALVIASLNMAGRPAIADNVATWVADRRIDVLLLQEVGPTVSDGQSFAVSMAERLGYHLAYVAAYAPGTYNQGLAILSRYPLSAVETQYLPFHRLRINWRCRNALAASVTTSLGSIRVVDLHLDTRINSRKRVAQVATALGTLDGTTGPQVIGGDFNSMNIGWIGSLFPIPYAQRQPAAIRRAMGANGFMTPFGHTRPTFKLLGLPLRLDWLYLKSLEATAWSVDDVPGSDHRGIWTSVTVKGDGVAATGPVGR